MVPFVTKKLHAQTPQKILLFLTNELGITNSAAQRLISKGRLSQNGSVIHGHSQYIEGECEVTCFEPVSLGLTPMLVANDFAVYDKPHGLGVHPHTLSSPYTLSDEIKHRFGEDANAAHRIDQETSGLVLVSLGKKSEPYLKQLFAHHRITKRYLAMVKGCLSSPLDIQEPLLRIDDPDLLLSMVVKVDSAGKEARTLITPLHYFPHTDTTLIEASPLSGRTHQIRVHLFHVKHPIVGDPLYGQNEADVEKYIRKELKREERLKKSGATRLLLHAHSLEFEYDAAAYRIVSQVDFLTQCFEAMGINQRTGCTAAVSPL